MKRLAGPLIALAALAAPASACPTCSVGQAIETLAIVLAFMAIPYVIVTVVWLWLRRLLASEAVGDAASQLFFVVSREQRSFVDLAEIGF